MKVISVVSSLVMVLALAGCDGRGRDVDIRVNGKRLAAHTEIKHGQTYVALDPVAEVLGLKVGFDPGQPEHGVLIQGKGKFVHLYINRNDCQVGDKTVQLDAPAVYVDHGKHRPMVPVGLVSEAFGATVRYRAATNRARATIELTPAP